MQEIVQSFIFDNVSVNKLVIEKYVNDLNTFGGLFFISIVIIIKFIVKDDLEHIKGQLDKH